MEKKLIKKSLLWIALCVYLRLAFLKFKVKIDLSIQQMLRLLQLNLFEGDGIYWPCSSRQRFNLLNVGSFLFFKNYETTVLKNTLLNSGKSITINTLDEAILTQPQ